MATVIDSLVIHGSNPAPRPSTANQATQRSRVQTPVSNPRSVSHPNSATESLKVRSRREEEERVRREQDLPDQLLTISGQGSGTFGVPESIKDSDQEEPGVMQGDLVLHGAVTPIVKKMEYLALVRQARQGMSSIDSRHQRPAPTPNAPREAFMVEGRKVSNNPVVLSRLAEGGGGRSSKGGKYCIEGMFRGPACYSVSELSFNNDKPEGHVDQYRMFQSRESRGGPRSVRSIRSDTTTSIRSLQFPSLTRAGSSEPGPRSEYERRIYNSNNKSRIIFAQDVVSESESDSEQVEADRILDRVKRSRSIKLKKHGKNDTRGVEEELSSCLNIEGRVETTPRDHTKWTPSKQILKQNKSLKSEGALLFRRHKLMEKKTEMERAKYNFSSVKSYLNFNKVMRAETEPDLSLRNTPSKPTTLNGKQGTTNTGVKRGQGDCSAVIFDLDDCFKVKTPRFDIRPAVQRSNTLHRGSVHRAGPGEDDATNTEVYKQGVVEELPDVDSPISREDSPVVRKTPRVPIVSVPSADSEHWTENMLT